MTRQQAKLLSLIPIFVPGLLAAILMAIPPTRNTTVGVWTYFASAVVLASWHAFAIRQSRDVGLLNCSGGYLIEVGNFFYSVAAAPVIVIAFDLIFDLGIPSGSLPAFLWIFLLIGGGHVCFPVALVVAVAAWISGASMLFPEVLDEFGRPVK